jgi:hypothetical protein
MFTIVLLVVCIALCIVALHFHSEVVALRGHLDTMTSLYVVAKDKIDALRQEVMSLETMVEEMQP